MDNIRDLLYPVLFSNHHLTPSSCWKLGVSLHEQFQVAISLHNRWAINRARLNFFVLDVVNLIKCFNVNFNVLSMLASLSG